MQLSVLSWNIWGGRRFDAVAQYILERKPEVIGLQEVKEVYIGERKENQAAKLAAMLGYKYMFCVAHPFYDRTPYYDFGNAIISRFPIVARTCHVLSGPEMYRRNAETEPRIAAEALVQLPNGGELRVLSTHLAYSHGFRPSKVRDQQMDRLLALLGTGRTVLMGDFNVQPSSLEIKRLGRLMANTDPAPNDPSWMLNSIRYRGLLQTLLHHRLDHIFVSRDIVPKSCIIGESSASDHLPLIAVIEV